MKKIYALLFGLLLTTTAAVAQTDGEISYTNVWLTVKAANDGGKVYATTDGTKTIGSILNLQWRASVDFKDPVPTTLLYGVKVGAVMLHAKADTDTGYSFAGWYLDADGDGELNVEKDELLGGPDALSYTHMFPVDDESPYNYSSEAAAKAGSKPAASEGTIFARFSRGATASVSYRQGMGDGEAHCGSVFISNATNEPGDQVTVRALPEDGFQFEYWQDAQELGNVISRDQTYTFTVQGGEKLYAYFSAIDGPVEEFPAEGGYKFVTYDQPWVIHEESFKAGAYVLPLYPEDLRRDAESRAWFDGENEKLHDIVTMISNDVAYYQNPSRCPATLLYGKGTVRFAYKETMGFNGGSIVLWSGTKGWTYDYGEGNPYYLYVFNERLGAFIEYANTDQMVNPDAPTKIDVPANVAYVVFAAYDLADNNGQIPHVIALSPDGFDKAVAGIPGVQIQSRTVKGQKIYTLSGVEVKTLPQKGIVIIDGKKVAVK